MSPWKECILFYKTHSFQEFTEHTQNISQAIMHISSVNCIMLIDESFAKCRILCWHFSFQDANSMNVKSFSSPRDSVQFFFQSIFLLLFRIEMILLLPFQCRCFLFLFGRGGSNFSGWDIQYMSYQEIKEYSYEGLNKPGNSERLVEPWNQVSLQRLMNVNIILLPCGEWMKEISLGF